MWCTSYELRIMSTNHELWTTWVMNSEIKLEHELWKHLDTGQVNESKFIKIKFTEL